MSKKLSKTIGLRRKYAFPTVGWDNIDSCTPYFDRSFLVYPSIFIGPEILGSVSVGQAGEGDMVNSQLNCTYILIHLSEAG